MSDYNYKLKKILIPKISDIKNINILELGVQKGRSTKIFLEICDANDGRLLSVDIDDCSSVSDNKRWKFLNTNDDNFDLIKKNINQKLDLIYLDTVHEAKHVEKIFYGYFNNLKNGGLFVIDDISHLPYTKNSERENFYCEINNRETFNKLLEIYHSNTDLLDLSFSFISSGLAIIEKKNETQIKAPKKILTKENSFKNLIRKMYFKIK